MVGPLQQMGTAQEKPPIIIKNTQRDNIIEQVEFTDYPLGFHRNGIFDDIKEQRKELLLDNKDVVNKYMKGKDKSNRKAEFFEFEMMYNDWSSLDKVTESILKKPKKGKYDDPILQFAEFLKKNRWVKNLEDPDTTFFEPNLDPQPKADIFNQSHFVHTIDPNRIKAIAKLDGNINDISAKDIELYNSKIQQDEGFQRLSETEKQNYLLKF